MSCDDTRLRDVYSLCLDLLVGSLSAGIYTHRASLKSIPAHYLIRITFVSATRVVTHADLQNACSASLGVDAALTKADKTGLSSDGPHFSQPHSSVSLALLG
jgi:hypothetical protein